MLVSSSFVFGGKIECYVQGIPDSIVNTYCLMHGTYTVTNTAPLRQPTEDEEKYFQKFGHRGFAHSGIRPRSAGSKQLRNNIYIWIPFFFCGLSFFFFLPHLLWKMIEGGLVKSMTFKMQNPEIDEEMRRKRVDRLVKCFIAKRSMNNSYATNLISIEIVQLFNVGCQFYTTHFLLGRQFFDYGIQYFNQENFTDTVFPKVAKCQFNRHGPGGDINNHDALCLLPLNILNEKLFLLLWVWLIFLFICSIMLLLYRALCLCSRNFRKFMMKGTCNPKIVECFCKYASFGDYIVICQISKSVDHETFSEFMIKYKNVYNKEINKIV
jgi:hypothetical protein